MPVYTYDCVSCGDIEVDQSIKDDKLTECPACGEHVERVITSTSFVLKGGGWFDKGGY